MDGKGSASRGLGKNEDVQELLGSGAWTLKFSLGAVFVLSSFTIKGPIQS